MKGPEKFTGKSRTTSKKSPEIHKAFHTSVFRKIHMGIHTQIHKVFHKVFSHISTTCFKRFQQTIHTRIRKHSHHRSTRIVTHALARAHGYVCVLAHATVLKAYVCAPPGPHGRAEPLGMHRSKNHPQLPKCGRLKCRSLFLCKKMGSHERYF